MIKTKQTLILLKFKTQLQHWYIFSQRSAKYFLPIEYIDDDIKHKIPLHISA